MSPEREKAYYKACAHKILPCHFCGVPAPVGQRYCFGCGLTICAECSAVHEMPYGEHAPEAHAPVPEDEIMKCWACGARAKRQDPEADLCRKCEGEKLGGQFGNETAGGTA